MTGLASQPITQDTLTNELNHEPFGGFVQVENSERAPGGGRERGADRALVLHDSRAG